MYIHMGFCYFAFTRKIFKVVSLLATRGARWTRRATTSPGGTRSQTPCRRWSQWDWKWEVFPGGNWKFRYFFLRLIDMLYNKRFQLAEVRHQRRRWRVHCWGLWSPQVRFLKEEKHFNLISCKKNNSIWSQLVKFSAVENLAQLDELFCRDTEPFSEFFEVVPSITFEMTKIKVHKINIFEETQAFHYPV